MYLLFSSDCTDKNKKKTITLSNGGFINPENVTVKCVNNIECKISNIGRFLYRTKFVLQPVNFANMIYYSIS